MFLTDHVSWLMFVYTTSDIYLTPLAYTMVYQALKGTYLF
jgi:hypothetical protein